MRHRIGCALALLSWSCAGAGKVVDLGNGQYEVTGFASYRDAQKSTDEAHDAADEHCAEQGKRAEIIKSDTSWARGERMDTTVVFTCADAS